MLKKITTIVLALVTGLGEPVQIFAEDQTQASPAPTEEATSDLDGGISNGYPTPAPDETTDGTDATPDATTDETGENADGNSTENEDHPNIEDSDGLVKASFASGVEQNEDGTYVWNVNPEEESHTFAYRLKMNGLDQSQVKVLVPSTVFRDGEEGDFIASDLESDSSKLHLKVYEIQTAEDGTEKKLEIKNEPRKEEQTDGVSAIAEANKEVAQETASPDISDIGGGVAGQKYSEHYVSQLAEESGVLEINSTSETPLKTSVLQVEYTVEDGIYSNVAPQVFTAVLNMGNKNSSDFVECESNELEFVKNDGDKELKENDVDTVTKMVEEVTITGEIYKNNWKKIYDSTITSFEKSTKSVAEVSKLSGAIRIDLDVDYPNFHCTPIWAYKEGTKLYYATDATKIKINDCSYIFCAEDYYFGSPKPSAITKIDLSQFEADGSSMESMFAGCSQLTSLKMPSLSSKSDVKSMRNMFQNCSSLTQLDLSTLDTSNITDMSNMFGGCAGLTSLNLSNFDTSNVTNMNSMFCKCSGLTSLDLSNFDTSKVTGMMSMFSGCSKLTSLKLSNFNTSKVVQMGEMFENCSSLTSLDTSNFNAELNGTSGIYKMFKNCNKLKSLDLSKLSINNVEKGVHSGYITYNGGLDEMFENCTALTSLDISNFAIKEEDATEFTQNTFKNCQNLKQIKIGSKMKFSNTSCIDKEIPNYSGQWKLNNTGVSIDLITQYDGSKPGTYYRAEKEYTYNIKYVSESGVALGTATVSGTLGSSKNVTAPAKTGYSTPVAQKITFDSVNAKNITFTYTPVNYTITYDVNGGNSLSGERTTYNVESSAYTLPTPSRAGHTFTGWTGSNGTTAQTSVTLAKGTTGNKSYKANWKANTYTVTYNANGGSGNMSKDTVTYGTSFTAKANGFTRPGYKFAGWTENADGTGSNWTNWIGKPWTWTYTRSITLYAQWTKDTYSISYNLNGGSISGNPTSYQVDTADITLKNPTKTGYTFTGWTGSNGNTPQTSVKIVKGSTGNKSYTANWSANTYTYNIKYVSKSGVALGATTVSGAYGSSKNVTAPAKTGYSTPVAQKVTFDSVNAKTITFTYTPVDYAITYDLVGGSISGQKTSYNIETTNFALPTPVRKGYTFAGWTGTGLSSATKSVTVAKGSTGARSYTATWAPTNYTITYNLDGGSVSGQKTSYNIETADFTLPTPSKTGHTFLGWTGTGLSSATKTVTVAKGSTGNRSYTANWSINQYDIILKGDGGTESVTYGGKTYPLDATHSVTIRAIYNTNTAVTYKVKPKYHIVSETGTSMSNTDFSWSNNIGKEGSTGGQTWTTCAFSRTITIKTASNQFTVAFNANTGTGTMNNQAVTNNANQKVNANAFKKTGYTFKNWNTNTDGTGATYANSATVDSIVASNGATVTLYAQWTKDTYSISYNLNGGSVSGNPTSYQVDTADITLKNPSKTGYSFAGWTGSNGTTAQTTVKIAKGSTGNKSYTANWTANTYTYNIKYVSKSGVSLGTATVSGTYGSSKNVTAPAKTGYTVPSAQKVTFDSVNAKTITFTYTPVDYTIIYDVNGGNSLSGERTTYNVESSAYTLPMPSRAGHTFTGWTGSNGKTAQTSVTLAKGTTGNKSYKANWKANTYTVTYNANGGSGNMSKDTVTYGTSFTAKANGFTRPGYKFAGWTENADGTGSNWTNWIGKPWTWTYTRSITLYAQWEPNKLTINYHNDGAQKWEQYPGDAVIDVADKDIVKTETVNYDSIYDHASAGLLDANRFTKTGYHTGEAWKVGSKTSTTKVSDRNGTIEGSTGQSVAKYLGQDLSKGDVTVDLYPVFVPNTYTNYIRHWAYGFENKEGNNNDKMAYHLKDTTFTKKYGEKVTYTTDDATSIPNGFSLRSNFGSSAYEESWKYYKMGTSFTQPAKATTAEYDYVPTTYTITYNLNGGTLSKENPSTYNVLYGVDFTNEPVRSGYKFLGWYINDKKVTGINVGCNATFSSADDLYAKLATRTTGNQTVEAKWEKLKDLTITNTVSGNMGSKDKDFTYTAQFPSSFANTTLKVQKNDDGVTTITVDTNGKCTFTLKHGESFTFKELTEAQYNAIKNLSNYGISETDYSKEGYKTTFKLKTDANGNLQILFSNQNGTILPTGIEAWGTGAVIAIIGALMLVAYWLVHKH